MTVETARCPRVVGASDDGTTMVLCGAVLPCAEHGRPVVETTVRTYRVHKLRAAHQVANALNNRRELTPITAWVDGDATWLLTVEVVPADE